MPEEDQLLCYHKGCGQKYVAHSNTKDSCSYHPGVPVFHDAYKGWSCCKKKCTDFTEFLNIKGCTTGYHTNEKPPEPEKPEKDPEVEEKVVQVRAPVQTRLPRPSFDAPLTLIKPSIASSLVSQLDSIIIEKPIAASISGEVPLGTSCKHGGCKAEFKGDGVDLGPCTHHPGSPVFHEGMKYWSCCTKRTTDFATFLAQVGCCQGEHLWTSNKDDIVKPICRHDWHQTGTHVVVAIYAKKYDPNKSSVSLNPVRAKINLVFPENNTNFEMDLELRGIIDVEQCQVEMLSTKVEIKLRKAEPGSWSHLSFPKPEQNSTPKPAPVPAVNPEDIDDEPVDLTDVC